MYNNDDVLLIMLINGDVFMHKYSFTIINILINKVFNTKSLYFYIM